MVHSLSELLSQHHDKTTFLARSLTKPKRGERHQQVAVEIPSMEFVWRWSLHILPKGMVRVRHYGHFGNRHRTAYLARCNELLGNNTKSSETAASELCALRVVSSEAMSFSGEAVNLSSVASDLSNASASTTNPVDWDGQSDQSPSSLGGSVAETLAAQLPPDESEAKPVGAVYHCPKCQQVMICTEANRRPSWADTMKGPHRPKWYPRSSSIPRSNPSIPSNGHPP